MSRWSQMKHWGRLPVVCLLLSVVPALAGEEDVEEAMTFKDIHETPVTALIGKEIVVEAGLFWEHATVKIPEDPRSQKELAAEAGPVKVRLEGAPFESLKRPGWLFVVGEKLVRTRGDDGKGGWRFGTLALTVDVVYRLKGKLVLRESFKEEMLKNEAFVKQCNNPLYWSQTLRMELTGVIAK